MKSTQIELFPNDPIFQEGWTIHLRPGIHPPVDESLEEWIEATFGDVMGVAFGPGGPFNSNVYSIR